LTLASPKPGEAAARAARSLGEALAELGPMLSTIKARLLEHAPDQFSVEFGVKFGGETGVILAKGTAEVNLKLTMT
jgi:Trypsin-co-occurring domain 1